MIRTGFSFHSAVGHLEDVAKRLVEIGWKEGPIADRCSTFGYVRWKKICEEHKIRPVYGVELAVTASLGEKKPTLDYWTFLAVKDVKYVHELVKLATTNPGREPSLSYKQACDATGVIKITGHQCQLGEISKKAWGTATLFFGLSPATPVGLYREALKLGVTMVAVPRNVYTCANDLEFYRVTLGRRASSQVYPQHIVSDSELIEALWFAKPGVIKDAIANRKQVLRQCKADLKMATLLSPPKKKTLRKMCEDGAKVRKINLKDPIYKERLTRELALIAEKRFEDYFYIIADMMQWAREKMIVGPARGSSCGSLACYLLGITAVDPIPHGLIFERFIDTTRADLPDIDLDFSDAKRHLIFEYCEKRYGGDRVARLGSVGMFKPKSALAQLGVALRIPSWMTNRVGEGAITRKMGDSRASSTIEDTLRDTEAGQALIKDFPEAMIVAKMEAHPNNSSQHAAGVVITDKPVLEYVAVDYRTHTTMCDKKDAEVLNLLKIDALGLTQLSVFERCLELIGKPPTSEWLEALPLDDPAAYEVLNKRQFCGVFQFLGHAMRGIADSITFKEFSDIVAATALVRPGPLASGGTEEWIKRHEGQAHVSYSHAAFEPFIKDTLGIVIYQEQVMEIGRQIGDLSWEDVTALRKAMSKSLGKEYFDKYGDKWKAGAAKRGIPKDIREGFWDDLCNYGAWAFNKSHSVAYAYVSYWCCWLKAHHPVEFAAATLDTESDPARQVEILRELNAEGVEYVSVDPEKSTDRWTPFKEGKRVKLLGPLTNIKGFGPATVQEILAARREKKPIRGVLAKRLANAKTDIDSLFPVADKVKELHPNLSEVGIASVPTPCAEVQPGIRGQVLIIALASRLVPLDENEPVRVQKRGGRRYDGPTQALNMFMRDDSGEIFCKINRYDYAQIGREVAERGRAGKVLYAIKGTVPRDFRMIRVDRIKFLGEM